jgi:hypothetical protein
VFVLDGGVFLEPEGLWIAGGQRATLILATAGRRSITVHFRNGPIANPVVLELGADRRTLTLAPGEERDIDVLVSAEGSVALTVTSPSGFRPSDRGDADARYLGVRIEIR